MISTPALSSGLENKEQELTLDSSSPRVWIRDNDVMCLCQRDVSNYYPHIRVEEENIKQDILTFFSEHIINRFSLSRYVMDVIRPSKDNVLLVDFNPWGDTTDALMFNWEELDSRIHSDSEFR